MLISNVNDFPTPMGGRHSCFSGLSSGSAGKFQTSEGGAHSIFRRIEMHKLAFTASHFIVKWKRRKLKGKIKILPADIHHNGDLHD